MSMSYSELVGYGMARGMSRSDATRFALDATRNGKIVRDHSEADTLLTAFAAVAGIALVGTAVTAMAVDDALLGVPSAIIGGGLGILGDLFDLF